MTFLFLTHSLLALSLSLFLSPVYHARATLYVG